MTPRMTGSRKIRCFAIGEAIGWQTCAIVAVGLAHGDGPVRRAAHHHALEDGLPADRVLIGAGLAAACAAGALEPALEALDAAAGVHELLLARVERVAGRADLDVELGLRRARLRTCCRRSSARSRARTRDGCRPSSASQDSRGEFRGRVAARDDGDDASRRARPRPCRRAARPSRPRRRARRRASRARRGSASPPAISSSVTSTTSSTRSRQTARRSSPANGAPSPSATVVRLDRHALAGRERRRAARPSPRARRRRRASGRALHRRRDARRSGRRRRPGRRRASASGTSSSELEPDRALAGDHERVVERVDERPAGLLDQLGAAGRTPRPARRASRSTVGAVAARGGDLLRARARHMTTRQSIPSLRGAVGERLRVVAGRDPDDTPRACSSGGQRRELVEHAARLERAGALEELGLQERRAPMRSPSVRRAEHRRPVEAPADRLARGAGRRHGSGAGSPVQSSEERTRRERLRRRSKAAAEASELRALELLGQEDVRQAVDAASPSRAARGRSASDARIDVVSYCVWSTTNVALRCGATTSAGMRVPGPHWSCQASPWRGRRHVIHCPPNSSYVTIDHRVLAARAVLDGLQQRDEVVAAARLARIAGMLVLGPDGLTKLTGLRLQLFVETRRG